MTAKAKIASAVFGFLVFSIAILSRSANSSICRNEQGKEVAWFVALRIPDTRTYWIFEEKSTSFRILQDETFLSKLFEQVDLNVDQVKLWNDEPPTNKPSIVLTGLTAHDKGVLYRSSKDSRGFYLLHSFPLFPVFQGSRLNPMTPIGSQYGQSMICISLGKDVHYDVLNRHIEGQNSQVYWNSFRQAANARRARVTDQVMDDYLEGTPFRVLTKTVINLSQPYEEFLRQNTKSDWIVESWGRPYQPDTCNTQAKVVNNKKICFGNSCFPSTADHSKYAISTTIPNLLCISGMNHMESQAKRGGSFVCFSNPALYAQLKTILSDYTVCPAFAKKKLI